MKILLAEDTKDMNRVVTAALEHQGYHVDSVFDGKEALEAAMQSGYDAMVMDIMMPEMDGIEVLKILREKKIITPVLLLTAKTGIDDRVDGLDAGADDYLTKPFSMKELLARVRAMTRRKNQYESKLMTYGDISLNGDNFELKAMNTIRLSVKEYELLQALMVNTETFLSADFFLEHIWDNSDAEISTVKLYVAYLNNKLKAVSSRVTILEKNGTYKLMETNENE
ncbi:MAG: response regulator transcription factor [Eubacterium sp.]|nr:response regulator transcription factor [Eubacterium sp.]